mmetsp:Transcript_5999/g.8985  ORF Transcript_5999/g.8985 Transcript_5999/m.8985 type:complete len:158 (+) Transcript_5999:1136-1609(+)
MWPSRPIEVEEECAVMKITFEDGDFKPTDKDLQELDRRQKKYGLEFKNHQTHIEVKTKSRWRIYVPERSRLAILYQYHSDKHPGAVAMHDRLQKYYWPEKREDLRIFLKACSCAKNKVQITPRLESKESRGASKIDDFWTSLLERAGFMSYYRRYQR